MKTETEKEQQSPLLKQEDSETWKINTEQEWTHSTGQHFEDTGKTKKN